MNYVRRFLIGAVAAIACVGPVLAADANVAGEWEFAVDTGNGIGTPHFSLKQDGSAVSGTYKGQFGEAPVTGTVKGNDLSLAVKVSAQGQELTVTYTGVVEGNNSVKGKVALGDFGEGTFTGKKAG